MAPRGLLSPLSSLRFEEKLTFSASQHLSFARSKWFTLPETESRSDVWSIKPPDFSIRLYRSVAEPREKERKTRSDPAVPPPAEKKRRSATFLPKVLHESYQKKDPPEFITSYRPPDALRSELMFVKTGKFPTGPYTNPKPHNFRPLDEDLPDMVTTYERDPGNMNLKLRNMDIIRTTKSESDFSSRDTRSKMDTFKPAEPKWDARLILPQPLWPPKSASYTVSGVLYRHKETRLCYLSIYFS
ncbi:hypothetical protein L3Q82_012995 [Scortum barcoo]|uniref:Uncharacterized protein n=1 Tax=Scortum barcoo TaxID=214431 RepID=A0ACB8W1T1_9TELE|nr:hypothetical protein L3Q82_012995 [Scortum barcoo]